MAARFKSVTALVGAATIMALAPDAAHAQANPAVAGTLSWSKTEAILGAPSALHAILAQQNALPPAARVQLRPASLSRAPVYAAIERRPATVSQAALNGRPDVFGSVALRVARTPLDARWSRVKRTALGGSAARYARALDHTDAVARIEAVNRYVNRRVRYVADRHKFGGDFWSAAGDTLKRGRGDCEDYAIAKLHMLRLAGIADRDLYFVIVKDLVRRSDHAVLVVRAAGRLVVLDNGTDALL
ncbi:MAG: transglutaminase-like cysteine peptidase, partial [Sphingomicrobium sp.]